MFGFNLFGGAPFGGLMQWLFGAGVPDTTTIFGPFEDPSHTVTFTDPASRLIIVTEEPDGQ